MVKEVIKRNGKSQKFSELKIRRAIMNANDEVPEKEKATLDEINKIVRKIKSLKDSSINIELIQDMIEDSLMDLKRFELARKYIIYRYIHNVGRDLTNAEVSVLSLINGTNKEVINENSNKNSFTNSTQRDLIAGEISKEIADKLLLPDDIKEAINKCWIHWHDKDYTIQNMFNCCLVDIQSMLDNGTVINGLAIESPHSFRVACNIMTQIIANVASNQYGGQSVAIKHLGKYLRRSKQRYERIIDKYLRGTVLSYEDFLDSTDSSDDEVQKAKEQFNLFKSLQKEIEILKNCSDEQIQAIKKIYESILLRQELRDGVQTIQYQINTLMTSNG